MTEPGEDEPTTEQPEPAREDAESADDAATGEGYGVAKARALLRMFREDTGRNAESARELTEWMIRRNR